MSKISNMKAAELHRYADESIWFSTLTQVLFVHALGPMSVIELQEPIIQNDSHKIRRSIQNGYDFIGYQDKNPPDINPQTKTPWTKTPLAKNPPDKTYINK